MKNALMACPIPSRTRRAVHARARGKCERCGERGQLDLHHLRRYTDVNGRPESIDGLETCDDLAALCRECHYSDHRDPAGEWWWDVEEKTEYWASFYAELERD